MLAGGLILAATGCLSERAQPRSERPDQSIDIVWLTPEKFRDVSRSAVATESERQAILDELAAFIRDTAEPRLKGRRLTIKFYDVDLEGDFEPTSHPDLHNVRIVREIYPARLSFSWELWSRDGTLINAGQEKLNSLAAAPPSPVALGDFGYTRELLRDWLFQVLRISAP